MRFTRPYFLPVATALTVITIGTTACSDVPSAVSHASLHDASPATVRSAGLSSTTEQLLKKVHAATARYHSTVQATKAGYVVSSPCVMSPAGGMGFHWVNQASVDPVFNPTEPEAVLYEPDAKGKLKLVAVEYIVIKVSPGQPAPTFGDQPFDVGGTPVPVPHWSLHVWVHKDNPNGVFTRFNPAVVCP